MLAKRWANVVDDGAALYQLLLNFFVIIFIDYSSHDCAGRPSF